MELLWTLFKKYLASQMGEEVTSKIKATLGPVSPHLRKVMVGLLLLFFSLLSWLATVIALAFGLFLSYSPSTYQYVTPAFVAAGTIAALAIVSIISSYFLLRKPLKRRQTRA